MRLVWRLSLAVMALGSVAVASEVHVGPILQSLDGAASISVMGSDGNRRDVKADEALKDGDVLLTGSDVAATVAFEKGAQVLLAGGSNVKIGQEAEEAGEPAVPSVEVAEGDVRAVVEVYQGAGSPAQSVSASPAPSLKSHRFVIRTKTAVMGVRGTDFVVSAKTDRFWLNTLSGTVEVAADLKGLAGSKCVPVGLNQQLTEDGPKPFVASEFLKEFHRKHPKLDKLYVKAEQDIHNGSLKAKFAALRLQAEEALKKSDPDTIEFPGKKKTPKATGAVRH